jgi:hypothetical protein
MEVKELIAKNLPAIKKLLFKEEETKMEANEAKLSDGMTIVKWDGELAVGTALMVVSESGLTPAPDGSHELESGTQVTVKDGLVTSIKTKEQEKEDETEVEIEMSLIDAFARIEKLETELKGLSEKSLESEKFNAVEAENTKLKEQVSKLEDSMKLMFELVEAMSNEPQEVEQVAPTSKEKKKTDLFNALEEISKNLYTKK